MGHEFEGLIVLKYQCSNVLYRHKPYACIAISRSQSLGCSQQLSCSGIIETSEGTTNTITPPLWTDLVKISSREPRHASSFSLECTDFKNVIFEKNHWAHSEDAEVAEVK